MTLLPSHYPLEELQASGGAGLPAIMLRAAASAGPQAAAEIRGFLALKGVDLSGEQQTKTRYALDFFAGEAK